ncbi:HTH-type transcriptional repressor RspR [Baekduia alba]|uniref:GntR family transcriptional regulator n=1 Tax=Baekduia alba TaxID=2997333 RepID=UPI0023405DD7|nr:GntR family transcriptional regulator [Baekduia alba]WCB96340.1 HTH-type transcriptional repressor RspR [Baekduia alba]
MTQDTTQDAPLSAADRVRAAIRNGDMVGGQRLVEAELSERFEVSRAAIRAALVELTTEGLVERIPNRGARVRTVTVEEAVYVTECRMVLEGLCARKAAAHATSAEIDELRELQARMETAVEDGEPLEYSELNARLHKSIRRIAAQPVAEDLLSRMEAQMVRHRFRLALRPGRPAQSLPQHLALIEAVARHDPDAAEQAMRVHLTSVIEALRATTDGAY